MLELRGITKTYRTSSLAQVALDKVSVSFRDNEFVAILGQSGSGKTTMLNVIGGLDHFDSGDLIIDSISTRDYRDRDWDAYRNNRIGFVFQSYNLIPHQSVLANVELALTLSGVSHRERRSRALAALEEVGLSEHVHKRPNQLSGGQMQRVAIARALVNDPEILLADEPTGALDSATSVQIMNLLQEVAKDRLVIMVTHNPALAQRYATRIVELADGRISSDSDPFTPDGSKLRTAKEAVRTSMSLLTALSLSFTNLMTKKGRTLLTSFAGSIGIIGIAAILALANGVNDYIARTEEKTLTSYPLSIQRTGVDMSAMLAAGPAGTETSSQDDGRVHTTDAFNSMLASQTTNDLAALKNFIDANGNGIGDHVAAIDYRYNITPQIYLSDTSDGVVQVNPEPAFSKISDAYGSGAFSSFVATEAFHQLPANAGLYQDKYQVMAGQWPQKADELVLVLDSDGSMVDYFEYTLGLRDHDELEEGMEAYYSGEEGTPAPHTEDSETRSYDYDQILGVTFSMINAADAYRYDAEYGVWTDLSAQEDHMKQLIAAGDELKIVGIVKATDDDTMTLNQGIGYTPALTEQVITAALDSQIVKDQLAKPDIDVFTGKSFAELAADGQAAFDISSLFTVDANALQAAFKIDPNALQVDLSSLDMSQIDLSGLDFSTLDMSGMDLSGIDPAVIAQAVDPSTMDLSGLDLSDLASQYPQLAQIDYATIINKAVADGVIKDGAGAQLSGISASIIQGALTYISEHSAQAPDTNGDGVPDVDAVALVMEYFAQPEVRDALVAAINSGEVIDNARLTQNLIAALGEDPAITEVSSAVSAKLGEQIATQLASQIGGALTSSIGQMLSDYMQQAMRSAMTQMMSAIQTQLGAQLETAMSNFVTSMSSAMSIDEAAFAQAFQLKMSQEDLAALMSTMMSTQTTSYESNLAKLNWADRDEPNTINIYPTSFEDKDAVKRILESYNADRSNAGQDSQVITYTDTVGLLMSSVTRIIDIISAILIAFVSISLVVSSIMIAIITYISVLERRKEIGILRAIGASKRDISHVFNAETIIEGLLAGAMGVVITLIISIPANVIVAAKFDVDRIAQLPLIAGLALIAISVVLTLIAGLFPAGKAAKEDPVEALRSE